MKPAVKIHDHRIVYAEHGIYAGWPANHGAWQWGDELLVGFIRGEYGHSAMHNVRCPLEKMLARSLDGGETWRIETPNVNFSGNTEKGREEQHTLRDTPIVRLQNQGAIFRVCGDYDHGGDDCPPGGAFYASLDRGRKWLGPYRFTGIEHEFTGQWVNTSRTAVMGHLWFLSRRVKEHWGTDHVLVATPSFDVDGFKIIGEASGEAGRIVMPSPVDTCWRDNIVFAARRREAWRRSCWVSAFGSTDGGRTWEERGVIGHTGDHNGNPPALVALRGGDLLVCAFANRSACQLHCAISQDYGYTWSAPLMLRDATGSDIGYPQLFKRCDGKLVCVYYWTSAAREHQHIAATIFEVKP